MCSIHRFQMNTQRVIYKLNLLIEVKNITFIYMIDMGIYIIIVMIKYIKIQEVTL